ncbi:MAG: hypothetical protein GC137_10480 [Alphaproteobacteria bacterium]|nr:hypothetical protein [Alphaproteobacteria bacterium]
MTQDTNTPDEHRIEGDRDIPSVAQNKDYSKLAIVAFVVVGIVAIIAVVIDGINKNTPRRMVDPEEISFKSVSSAQEPYIEEPIPEPSKANLVAPTVQVIEKDQPSRMELMLQQEALKRAKAAEEERQRRLASPQIVFDTKGNRAVAVSTSATQAVGRSFGGGDPNLSVANQYGDAQTNVARATQLQNLGNLIAQGTMIDGILETAVQSDLPGMVRAITSDNTYSFDGTQLIIPKGSRLIGRYNSGLVRGQSRVFVIWNRLIRPDGVSVSLGSFGTDGLGRSGLGGHLDTHFFERFGSSILLSLIDAGVQIGVNATDDRDVANVALDSGSDFSRAAEIALENSIGIRPTVNVHQGTEIKVFVGQDLDFSQIAGTGE